MQNSNFLSNKLDKLIFHNNLNVFFSIYPYTHVRNTLFINDMPYKSTINGPYSAIFLESFGGHHGKDKYMLGSIFFYLENLHSFWYGVPTFVKHNPFGRIKSIDLKNPGLFKNVICEMQLNLPTHFL